MLSEPMYSARYLRLPSTGSNEMKHCRRKISLGRIESPVSFIPISSKWRSIRSRHPAAARFEKRDLQLREAITYAAHDETCRRSHHLERMRNHMAHCESFRE